MGVIVNTQDGADTFSGAADFYVEEGRLVIEGNEAVYSPGYWLSARVGGLASAAEPSPPDLRAWDDLHRDVPIDIAVSDADGDVWKWSVRHGWQCWIDGRLNADIEDPQSYGPFTEVL